MPSNSIVINNASEYIVHDDKMDEVKKLSFSF